MYYSETDGIYVKLQSAGEFLGGLVLSIMRASMIACLVLMALYSNLLTEGYSVQVQ